MKLVSHTVGVCLFSSAIYDHNLSVAPAQMKRALMTNGAFSRNVGKLLCKLKLVTDNLPLHL